MEILIQTKNIFYAHNNVQENQKIYSKTLSIIYKIMKTDNKRFVN